jgi:hypothetical protein
LPEEGNMKYVVATQETSLNVRSGPGKEFPVVRKVSKGAVVEVEKTSGEWSALVGGGWVSSAYLRPYQGGAAATGTKKIVVDLGQQMLTAYAGESKVYEFPCVTGDSAHPTEPGQFRVIRKCHPYTSRTYNVPMNYAMFFTGDGKAIHQYHGPMGLGLVRSLRQGPGGAAFGSHGCVRLTEENARAMYAWAPMGTAVVVR